MIQSPVLLHVFLIRASLLNALQEKASMQKRSEDEIVAIALARFLKKKKNFDSKNQTTLGVEA